MNPITPLMPHSRWLAAALSLWCAGAFAEAPMVTDDAGTLGKGGYKVEFEWAREGSVRGPALGFGFAPVEHLEIGLVVARASDHATVPSTAERTTGLSFKWVPLTWGETTAGLKLELANARPDGAPRVRDTALTLLLTHRYDGGHAVHLNLGPAVARPQGGPSQSVNTWSIGGEWALSPTVSLTGDLFGDSGPGDTGRQLGLRWRVQEGVALSIGLGRQNGQNLGRAVAAWEF
ncbi:MAG: hypothetical protein JNK28_13140 [Burkholderiaceae bacterium]|nr:hypothetical protein [Burkholderiaceae bacterium]